MKKLAFSEKHARKHKKEDVAAAQYTRIQPETWKDDVVAAQEK